MFSYGMTEKERTELVMTISQPSFDSLLCSTRQASAALKDWNVLVTGRHEAGNEFVLKWSRGTYGKFTPASNAVTLLPGSSVL